MIADDSIDGNNRSDIAPDAYARFHARLVRVLFRKMEWSIE